MNIISITNVSINLTDENTLCGALETSSVHIMFQCHLARLAWGVIEVFQFPCKTSLLCFFCRGSCKKIRMVLFCLAAVCWGLRKARNDTVFNHKSSLILCWFFLEYLLKVTDTSDGIFQLGDLSDSIVQYCHACSRVRACSTTREHARLIRAARVGRGGDCVGQVKKSYGIFGRIQRLKNC